MQGHFEIVTFDGEVLGTVRTAKYEIVTLADARIYTALTPPRRTLMGRVRRAFARAFG